MIGWILILGSKFFLISILKILVHYPPIFSVAVEKSDVNLILVLSEVIYSFGEPLNVTKFHSKGRLSNFILMNPVMCVSVLSGFLWTFLI